MNTDNVQKLVDGRPRERAYAAIQIGRELTRPKSRKLATGEMPAALDSALLPEGLRDVMERLYGVRGKTPGVARGMRRTGANLATRGGNVDEMFLTAPARKECSQDASKKEPGENDEDAALRTLAVGMFDPSHEPRTSCALGYWLATGDSHVVTPVLDSCLEMAADEKQQLYTAHALAHVDRKKVRHLVGPGMPQSTRASARARTSSMTVLIHGTFATNNEWHQPGGSLHTHIKENVFPDLYSDDDFFRWSGDWRVRRSRLLAVWQKAADDLVAWCDQHPTDQLRLITHSYGSSVVNLATLKGLPACTLIQLSPGVHDWSLPDIEQITSRTVFNFYASLDWVLLAARARRTYRGTPIQPHEHRKRVARVDHSFSNSVKAWTNPRFKLKERVTSVCT